MTRAIWTAVLAAMLTAGAAVRSQAGIVIYNNLPTSTYTPGDAFAILGTGRAFGPASHTETFVAAASGTEGDIQVAMSWTPSGNSTADFTLTLKNSSNTTLDVLHGTAPNGDLGGPVSVLTVFSTLNPLLTAGQTYTLTASPGSSTTFDSWDDQNDSNQFGKSGFLVETTSVPEPSTWAMLGLIAAGTGVARWRSGRSCRGKSVSVLFFGA